MSSTNIKKKRPKPRAGDSSPPFRILSDPSPDIFPSKEEILRLLAVIAIAASVAFACNFAVVSFNRRSKPFCDTGELPQDPISDLCEPCPDNGHCSNGQLVCFHGFKKQGRKCTEDGEINQTAKKFSDWIEDHVCNAYAQALCDEAGKIWFQEEDVLKLLDEHELRASIGLKDDNFLFAKQKAKEMLEVSLENRAILNGSKEYKCPDMRVQLHKPLLCCVRQWIYEHAFLLAAFSISLLGFVRIIWTLREKQNISARAEQVYEQVCEILEENATMAKNTSGGHNPWVVSSWLRDHLLLSRERKDAKLWKKVEELLLEDSRIDQYPKLVKGESKIVLEWQVDGSLSSKMREKRTISKTKLGSYIGKSFGYRQREASVSESLHS